MEVEALPVSEGMKRALRSEGVERLYPHQVSAIERGLMEGRSMVVSAPTASGKTLLAVLAAYRHLSEGRKVLYLTPLRALTTEKVTEFARLFGEAGMRVKVRAASGDYDDRGDWLSDSDLVVATYEKADSLVRHGASWLGRVRLIVVDEVHMIGDRERGPTLEMTVAKLLEVLGGPQVLCLSATIRNAEEIARWLDAELVRSDFRPVPLKEGVLVESENMVLFSDGTSRRLEEMGDGLLAAVRDGLRNDGQVLVFAMTRRKAEAYAKRIAGSLVELGDGEELSRYVARALEDRDSPSSEQLAELISRGVAFHHAGLSFHHRSLVEEAFRSRALKVLCATTTLAAGVNLPARTVVIPEYRKYAGSRGYEELSVMEYKQLCGRAGRPKYDRAGYAVLIARTPRAARELMNAYVLGEPEKVWSFLASERHLRSHVLSLVATEIATDEPSLHSILGRTFFAHQYGQGVLRNKVGPVLEFLEENGMIRRGKGIEATPLGRRVSELYIDPMTAVKMLELTSGDFVPEELATLAVVSMVPDMQDVPVPGVPKSVLSRVAEENRRILPRLPDPDDSPDEYELYLEGLAIALTLEEWIGEVREKEIYERMRIEPGDFAVLRERAEWIAYSAGQVLRVVGRRGIALRFAELAERIRHGVRPDILELVSIPEVGRVRGRELWRNGFRSLREIAEAPVERLAKVPGIGQRLAERIKAYAVAAAR